MRFRIRVLRRADRDVDRIVWWIACRQKAPQGAARWYRAYKTALNRLARFADQYPFAPENDIVDAGIRHLTFKTRRGQPYRLLFMLVGDEVRLLHVRSPGQDLMRDEQLHLDDDV